MISVGERLALERKRKGIAIEEVSKATKIRPQFIEALEKGNYKALPSSAYIQGFIRNYSSFLGLPSKEIAALFRREFNEAEFLGVLPESFTQKNNHALPGFRLHQMFLLLFFGFSLSIGFIFYQYRFALFNPFLQVISPKEKSIVATGLVTVVGKTDSNATVTINDTPVLVDKDGNFNKEISSLGSDNILVVKAMNSFGKKSIVIRHVTLH